MRKGEIIHSCRQFYEVYHVNRREWNSIFNAKKLSLRSKEYKQYDKTTKRKIILQTTKGKKALAARVLIYTYIVPAIPVLICDLSAAAHRASPKSAILGERFSSSRMLLILMSLWIIFLWEPP